MASLADEIALLTNPAPAYHDPEDIDDDARARVATHGVDDVDDDVIPTSTTKLRRRAAVLLADEDSRYAGKRVSRKRLQDEGTIAKSVPDKDSDDDNSGDDDDESDDNEDDEEEGESEEEDGEEEDEEEEEEEDDEDELANFKKKLNVQSKGDKKTKAEFSFEADGDFSKYGDDSEDDDESGDEDDDDDDESGDGEKKDDESDEDDSEDVEDEGDDEGISKFSKTKVDEEVKKGEATKTQLTLWDQLLKARIELQKVLVLVNQLPQPEMWDHFVRAGGNDYSTALAEGQAAVKSLLDKIFYLQLRLLLQHPDTKTLEEDPKKKPSQPAKAPVDDDDEEIPSDSDVEEEADEAATPKKNLKRKHKLNEYPEVLAKRHKAFTPYRNDTIQKWFDKTRVATGKLNKGFSAFEQSALKQIRQILSDRDRLVKRTQLKRSPYRILGTPEVRADTNQEQDDAELQDDMPKPESRDRLKEYDPEIFDDDDFYHQLLRELIERKSSNTNDPVALSRQWLELQKLRSKVKRKVDTRASKGRKIRYDILPKLVNFMAPNDTSPWTDEARDELYSSLFGKRNPELQVH